MQKMREFSRALDVRCKYNFGEWEVNELARRLTEAGKTAAAVAILEMNGEFHPKSSSITFTLAELHRGRGENEKAIAQYRATLTLAVPAAGQDVQARMQTWSKALGVECTHCHEPGSWTAKGKRPFGMVEQMNPIFTAEGLM